MSFGKGSEVLTKLLFGVLAFMLASDAFATLPQGFTQLAFLESTGTQYIDTGMVFGGTNGFSITYQIVAPEGNQIVCGSRASSGDSRCMVGSNYTTPKTYAYVGWNAIKTSQIVPDSYMGTTDVNFLDNGMYDCRRDRVGSLDALVAQTGSFWLFAGNMAYAGGSTIYGKCRIREVRISSGKNIVKHFVSARRDSDSVLGMFDLVGGEFYTNAGTGTFIGGEPVVSDPDAYVRLSWLESSGGQYIDTGVAFTDANGFAITYQIMTGTDNQIVCGSRASGGDSRCMVGSNRDNNDGRTYAYVGWNGILTSWGVSDATEGDVKVNYLGSRTYDCRGERKGDLGTLSAQTGTFWLFAGNMAYQGGSPIYGKCRIMSFAMTYGNALVMKMVPVRRKADGKPGMYDTLNNVFYTNQGTGEFIEGTPVLPEGYAALEYVESSGVQYINTGVKCASDVSVQASIYNPISASKHLIGARVAYQNSTLGLSFQTESGQEGWCVAWGNQVKTSLLGASKIEALGDAFHVFEFGGSYVRIDGKWCGTSAIAAQTFSTDLDLFAFSVNNGGTPHAQGATVRISNLAIFKNGSIVREFLPAMSTNDFIAGFYDMQTGSFYENAGSGRLIAGDIVGGMDAPDAFSGVGIGVSGVSSSETATKSFSLERGGLYRLCFQCKAGTSGTGHSLAIQMDGKTLGTVSAASTYGWTTANFDVKMRSGNHVLTFQGVGDGKSTLVDAVTLRRLCKVPVGMVISVK